MDHGMTPRVMKRRGFVDWHHWKQRKKDVWRKEKRQEAISSVALNTFFPKCTKKGTGV
jgi:hypothetical protein